jgi:hypothetical protein
MGKGRIVSLDGLPFKKDLPDLTFGRPIARAPMHENNIIFQRCMWDLANEGYKLHQEDMESLEWWLKTVAGARNLIARKCLDRKSDYLIFVDDDMTIPHMADSVKKMIAADKDIIMGICTCKPAPHFPNIGKIESIGESGTICDSVSRHIFQYPRDKIFEIDNGATAFVCIKRKVLEKMEAPWFYMPPNYKTGNIYGEDITFFFNAKMHGFELWCDPTIRVGHLGYVAWSHVDRPDAYEDYVDGLVERAKKEGWDCTHNLVPEVQKRFKEGKGPKKIFV